MRCLSALFTLNSRMFAMAHLPGDAEEKRRAALTVANELLEAAHRADR
jgi:hypothetical protein